MDLMKWDPTGEMSIFRNELRKIFGSGNGSSLMGLEEWTPTADIIENDDAIIIKIELPEIEKKDIKIEVEGDTLTVSGERELEKEVKKKDYRRIERSYGAFSRSFYLPEYVDRDKIEAKDKDGVLRLTLPKTEAAPRKTLNIDVT